MRRTTKRSIFVMAGAREVLEQLAGDNQFSRQIAALERAVGENVDLALSLAKSLVETICKTVLNERGAAPEAGADGPALLKQALNTLQLWPDGHPEPARIKERLRKTINGLQTVVTGLCELRNEDSAVSHGKDAYAQPLDRLHAEMAARASDTIVHFLFMAHLTYPVTKRAVPLQYGDNSLFNEWVDESNQLIQIFELTFRPSEVLFECDEQAYRDYLQGFSPEAESESEPESQVEAVPQMEQQEPALEVKTDAFELEGGAVQAVQAQANDGED